MRARTLLVGMVMGWLVMGSRGGCQEGENAFIMGQMHQIPSSDDAPPGPAGSTCSDVSVGSGSSGLGSESDDFWTREESNSRGWSVQVGSFEQVLEQRFYDRAFIAAHEVDRFTVTTRNGERYAFVYWGGDTCERCPPGASEVPPGNPFECPPSL